MFMLAGHLSGGNPYVIHKGLDRDPAIRLYINFILKNKTLLKDLHELKGKTLACHCAPHRCHADVLAFLANDVSQEAISDLDSVFRMDLESELIKIVNKYIFGASLV